MCVSRQGNVWSWNNCPCFPTMAFQLCLVQLGLTNHQLFAYCSQSSIDLVVKMDSDWSLGVEFDFLHSICMGSAFFVIQKRPQRTVSFCCLAGCIIQWRMADEDVFGEDSAAWPWFDIDGRANEPLGLGNDSMARRWVTWKWRFFLDYFIYLFSFLCLPVVGCCTIELAFAI